MKKSPKMISGLSAIKILQISAFLICFTGSSQASEISKQLTVDGKPELPRVLYKQFGFLTNETFGETMERSGLQGYLVFFGARWCGHSRQFNSTFKQFADIVMKGDLKRTPQMGFYLIQDPKDDELHIRFRVNGFPTLVYISDKKFWVYQGERELPLIVNWLEEIFDGDAKEGSRYPDGPPTLWSELIEVWSDIKYTLRHNLKHYPFYTWCAIMIIGGSISSVMFIFGILIYDSLIIGDSIEGEEIEADKKEK